MTESLRLTRGAAIAFAADGEPCNGVIVRIVREDPLCAGVTVETESSVKEGAQLTIPGIVGGCGLAHPVALSYCTKLTLSVPYDHINQQSFSD